MSGQTVEVIRFPVKSEDAKLIAAALDGIMEAFLKHRDFPLVIRDAVAASYDEEGVRQAIADVINAKSD